MTTHIIAPEHLDILAQSEHVLKWLQAEQARVQAEMLLIAQQWQREEDKLRRVVSNYGVTGQFTLDTKAGHIITEEQSDAGAE